MSTDNPTQLLTTRDLSQLRGHLQSGVAVASTTTSVVAAPTVAAAHGYRTIAPPPPTSANNSSSSSSSTTGTTATSSSSSSAAAATPPVITPVISTSNINMPASASKYVFLQHNHNGGFTAYDGSAASTTATGGVGSTGGGNIVLLATEPLEIGTGEALVNVRTSEDDGELRPLSWLNDRDLIKGIVTTTAGQAGKRRPAVAIKTTDGEAVSGSVATNGNLCIVSDLIEELPTNLSETSEQEAGGGSVNGSAVYSTTTVHKGASGTTTVVEYKASKANQQQQQQTTYLPTPTRTTMVGHSYMPVVVSSAANQPLLSPAKQQLQQQIYVTSNGSTTAGGGTTVVSGGAIFKATSQALCSPSTSSSSSSNTTTHHPHKKYLREKMHVQMDHSSHVASTVTVVSSPASSNNSSISSSNSGSVSGSGSSTAAVNGGNSPVPKASSFSTVFEAVNYATSTAGSNSSSNSTPSSQTIIHGQDQPAVVTTTTLISAGSLPPGYSFVNHVASTPHVISTPANVASPETPPGAALLPGTYYTTSTTAAGTTTTTLQPRSLQLSVSPPPPQNLTSTSQLHNGSVGGGAGGGGTAGSGGGGGVNLRSPNSYTSYDNEDSLKEFDLMASSRIHTSTPQYSVSKNGANGYGNGNSNVNGGGAGSITPQKQKHPNNVPYDPQVHTDSKPPYSFSSLIFMAIEGSNEKALPVKEIYAWIVQHFPYFKTAPNGWKNSVRHNLSLNKSFVKVEKAPNMGKGSLWRVEPQQRQNLIQALNRSPFFPNSAVDKISPSLKSPSGGSTYDSLDGGSGAVSSVQSVPTGAGVPAAAVAMSTPTKSNGLVVANGASQATNAARPHSPNGGGSGSHARFDPKLFPNLSRAFGNIREDSAGQQLLQDVLDDDLSGDYHNNNNNNNNNNGSKYNYVGLNGTGASSGSAGVGSTTNGASDGINFERLARDCGADSMDDVHAAAAMLFLKHGSKAFSEPFQNGSAPVITSSPSEDHTYSAGGNSNADSGSSTPLANGNVLASVVQAVVQAQNNQGEAGSDSNGASSDAAYDSSEENHDITPEEMADRQRHRDGVDALLSLSRSSIVECGSVATTHYYSNGSGSGSSHGSPHKRASSHSLEEEHLHHHLQQQQQQQQNQHPHQQHLQHQFGSNQAVYTNGSGSKMALLSSAAANVALAHQQQQQQQQQQIHQDLYTSSAGQNTSIYLSGVNNHCMPGVGGVVSVGVGGGMLPQHLSAAMVAAASKNKVKPLRGLRTKIKRKSAWMR
ncbi:cell wall protein IFF6 [Drosophila eugracilis]|uniref:cell wall protein IFF6 n=1 Tax=Drosophila eugracilis TaxID=29029 RepID=UPI0007E6D645|nr:cell wall protein IFF6 [Drosophila eugracilis]XP_017066819.1 cell wall protein IFF6 [Drosophila eugracilis]XP_017066820.1 cell wall protein IFF6 [Drosophila eugracilis]XP_017066821.1 cell wall protein IFF6 [Drosophila eugracilis]